MTIWQRIVNQLHLIKQRAFLPKLDLARGAQRDVIRLTLADQGLLLTIGGRGKTQNTLRVRRDRRTGCA